jgi:hypothetical protein
MQLNPHHFSKKTCLPRSGGKTGEKMCSPRRNGRGGVWGGIYLPPPRTSIPPVKTGWGYCNFFHVVKDFSEKPATLFLFCSPQAKFLGVGGYIPPPPPEKTCLCLSPRKGETLLTNFHPQLSPDTLSTVVVVVVVTR